QPALIRPFRMFTRAALEVLCAPASAAPISPDVMLLRKSDDGAAAALIAAPSASASAPAEPETAGSTAIGDWALEPSGVLTYVLYAWPPTDWALPTAASPATSPTTSPRAARRFTQCMLLPFISSLLPWIPMANELGWCRPLMTRAPRCCHRSNTSGPCPRWGPFPQNEGVWHASALHRRGTQTGCVRLPSCLSRCSKPPTY